MKRTNAQLMSDNRKLILQLTSAQEKLKTVEQILERLAYRPLDPVSLCCGRHYVMGHTQECSIGLALAKIRDEK